MAKKPGVMIYFEVRPCLTQMSIEEKGRLFDAILSYAEDGEVPDFDDRLLIAWSFIRQRIDFDQAKYDAKCRRAKEAREAKEAQEARERRFSRSSF